MKATIQIRDAQDHICDVFAAELKETVNDRGKYTLRREGEDVIFDVVATDAVALRATLNAIAKQLVVFEKMQKLENE